MIHPFDQDRPSPIVDDGDDAGPMIALRLRFGSGHHFACGGQGDDFLVGELRRGTAGCNGGDAARRRGEQALSKGPGR